MMGYRIKTTWLLIAFALAIASCTKEVDNEMLMPDAGPNFLNIENDGYVVQLNAQPAPNGQTGTWRIYIGENGYFDDEQKYNAKFYGEPGESYVLGWELTTGSQYKSQSITVSFAPLQTEILSLPPDTLFNNVSLYLNALTPRFGAEGKWEIIAGESGRIINAQQANAEFVGQENKHYKLKWSVSYGSKSVWQEIEFQTDTLRAQAGDDNLDIRTANNLAKFFTLTAFLPAGATGKWSILNGEDGTIHLPENAHSLFEGLEDRPYSLSWTVKLDQWESVDTLTIRFRGKWGTWVDERDGQSYRFAEINGLEWMADNYNYAGNPGAGSWYYGFATRGVIQSGHALETEEERKSYGRLYDWPTAIETAPPGWRLPTVAEFDELVTLLGGVIYAGPNLKVGGSTGMELGFAGYLEVSSVSDQAYRNIFTGQDSYGMYWFSDHTTDEYYAYVYDVSTLSEKPNVYPMPTTSYGISVRYVRDVVE